MLIESDRLYIVCNSAEQANFRICLAKYQQQQTCVTRQIHIVSAQLGNSTAPDHTTGLIALAAAHPLPDLLIVLDGACLCEPGFSLQRFVQHTLTRNADMISFSPTILPGPSGSSAAWVELQGSSVNPRAVSITQQCSPTACYAVGPVYGLYQPTLSALLQGGASRLQDFLQLMLQSTAVYALPVHCSFDLSSLEGYLYADAFCTFCEQQWALLHSPMLSASAASPAVALPSSPQQVELQATKAYVTEQSL